jgi:hypothetical protein
MGDPISKIDSFHLAMWTEVRRLIRLELTINLCPYFILFARNKLDKHNCDFVIHRQCVYRI